MLFIEDLCEQLNNLIIKQDFSKLSLVKLNKIQKISIEDLAKTIKSFQNNYKTNYFFESENELEKNLYKTYMSFIKNN